MKTKKICWLEHSTEFPMIENVALSLGKLGVESVFVCKTRRVYEYYLKKGFPSFYISEIFNDGTKLTEDDIIKLDQKYGPPGIKAIGGSDVQLDNLFGLDQTGKEELVAKAYLWWEKFMTNQNIDYFIGRDSATFMTRTIYNLAHRCGLPFAQLWAGPADDLVTLDDVNENHVWSDLLTILCQGVRELSPEERSVCDEFINKRLASIESKMRLRLVPPSFLRSIKNYLGLRYHSKKRLSKDDPIVTAALIFGHKQLWKKIIWKYFTRIFFHYDKPRDEDYVFFPFYSGLETFYLSNHHFWALNEVSLIKEVAHSLPIGCKLYVKEHPMNPGDFSFRQLRELRKIPNVRVLFPSVNSNDLVKKSKAVIVMEGTTGWEAFLEKRPVICFGTSFFAYSSLIYRPKSISKLPEIIWQAIRDGSSRYVANEKEWFWFIYAVLSSCGSGSVMYLDGPKDFEFPTDENNANQIANLIFGKVNNKVLVSDDRII